MNRKEVLEVLKNSKSLLVNKYGINVIGLFGSYADNSQRPDSDIDILVEFSRPIGMEVVDLVMELEDILDGPVDLVSKQALKPELLKVIEGQVVYV